MSDECLGRSWNGDAVAAPLAFELGANLRPDGLECCCAGIVELGKVCDEEHRDQLIDLLSGSELSFEELCHDAEFVPQSFDAGDVPTHRDEGNRAEERTRSLVA